MQNNILYFSIIAASSDYLQRRERNNLAVRKSREKAKQYFTQLQKTERYFQASKNQNRREKVYLLTMFYYYSHVTYQCHLINSFTNLLFLHLCTGWELEAWETNWSDDWPSSEDEETLQDAQGGRICLNDKLDQNKPYSVLDTSRYPQLTLLKLGAKYD